MNNNEVLKEQEFSEDNYRSVRNTFAALAEKVIWRHKTLCESDDATTIAAIANKFVQEHGDTMLLEMIEKLQEIYSRYTQRYQLIVKVNGDPFQTSMFSYLNIEECLDVAQNYNDMYDGNHDFAIIDTNFETRRVYSNEEVRSMLKPKQEHHFWVASSDDNGEYGCPTHDSVELIDMLDLDESMDCGTIFEKVFDYLDDNEDGQIPRSIVSSIADGITAEICVHFNIEFHKNEW